MLANDVRGQVLSEGRPSAERALDDPRGMLGVIDVLHEAAVIVDRSSRIVAFNRAAAELFGYAAAEVVGRRLDVLLPEHVRGVHRAHLQRFADSGATSQYMANRATVSGRRKDGTEFAVRASIARIGAFGADEWFVSVLRAMPGAEEEAGSRDPELLLRAHNDFLVESQRIAQVGSWARDLRTGVSYWTPQLFALLGLDRAADEPGIKAFLCRVHPDDLARVEALNAAAVSAGTPWDDTFRVVLPDGAIRTLSSHGRAELDEHGTPVRSVGTLQDVTAITTLQETLTSSERRAVGILDSLPAKAVLLDGEGTIIATNGWWRRGSVEYGLAEDFGIGENYLSVADAAVDVEGGGGRRAAAAIRAVLAGRSERAVFDYPCNGPQEPPRWFEFSAVPLQSGVPGAVVMHQDVTDRYQALRALEDQVDWSDFQARLARSFLDRGNEETLLRGLEAGLAGLARRVDADCVRLVEHVEGRHASVGAWSARSDDPWCSWELDERFAAAVGDVPFAATRDELADGELVALLADQGVGSIAVVPIVQDGECIGSLGAITARIDPAWPVRALGRLQPVAATFAHLLDQRASSRQLHRLDARLKALARNSSDTILLVDAHTTIRYATESAEHVLGIPVAELVGQRFLDLMDPADHEPAIANFRLAATAGSSTRFPFPLRLAASSGRHVEVVATDARDDPAVGGVVLNVRDIEDRVRAESEAQRVGNALEAAALGVAFASLDGRITHVNRSLVDLLGRSHADDIVGTDVTDLGAEADTLRRLGEELVASGSWAGEVSVVSADGSPRNMYVTASVTRDAVGCPSGFMASFVDVTERRQVERALRASEAQLAYIIETAPVVMFSVDPDGYLTMLKGRDLRMARAGRLDVPAQSLFERFADVEEIDYLRRALDGEATNGEIRTLGRVFQVSIAPMRDSAGTVTGAVGVVLDTTERAAAEQAYRDSQRRFQVLVEQVSDAIVAFDREGTVSYASPAALEMYGPAVAPGGGTPDLFSMVDPSDVAMVRAASAAVAAEPGATRTVRFGLRRDGQERRVIEATFKNLLDDPVIGAVVAYSREATERDHFEKQLSQLALHDTLTGLPNRSLLSDRIEQALARNAGGSGTVAVLFLDIDQFKVVNDSLGHAAGDELLRLVAGRLSRTAHNIDTVARFGGDEFVVLVDLPIPAASAAAQAKLLDIARRLCRSLTPPAVIAGRPLEITASIGIACAHDLSTAETLIRDADAAMYLAKRRGRNQVAMFDGELRAQVQNRLELEIGLRRALSSDVVTWHYQPIVSLASGAVVGFESLMRWVDPERGAIPPSDFIPVAEDSELIEKLGRRALERACCQLVTFERRAAWDGGPYVAVNAASRQLTRDFSDQVSRLLRENGAAPGRLVIELTEGTLMQDSGAARDALRELRAAGVRIAIDDFGTGYSSLAYLEAFPVDIVKIDRSFVATLGRSRRRQSLVQAIISMAHALDIRVVAEGVETEGQLDILRQLGCDAAQGFYFSPAVQHPHLLPSAYRF